MNNRCVILVPFTGAIEWGCEEGLQALEKRGYQVRRVPGFSAIDFGRCVMARDALLAGFDELMWIDSDVCFHPDDVEKLRKHQQPIVCGIYAKKGRREFACEFQADTQEVQFGQNGGLLQIRYAGFGFMHTRRTVYEIVREYLQLPACNQRFGPDLFPWFMPMLVPDGSGQWYLSEDYAFCERARQAGFRVMADTKIRLFHLGTHGFSWEEAGKDLDRYASYTYRIHRSETPG